MAAAASSMENRRILVVDDQVSIHEDFKKILESKDDEDDSLNTLETELFGNKKVDCFSPHYQIESALQGREGIEAVRKAFESKLPFALAFVDVRMPPGIDGIETIKAMCQIDPDLQVVICTAFSDYSWEDTLDSLGQSDKLLVLKKPFDIIEVSQVSFALVEKWNLAQAAHANYHLLEEMVQVRTKQLDTKNKELEKTINMLNEAKAKLYQADKLASIGQLAAGLAHEINNPIGYVSGNLMHLQQYLGEMTHLFTLYKEKDKYPENTIEKDMFIKKIKMYETQVDISFLISELDEIMSDSIEGVERVSNIVQDLCDFSHVNTGEIVPVDVNRLIEKTLSVARSQLKEKVTVTKEFSDVPKILVNGGKLGQVFLNLLINALQACEEEGVIRIATYQRKEFVYIEIQDDGKGIPEEIQNKIFDPFFTSKPVGQGTGLGLHIARNIIVQHRGEITFKSKVNEGTKFTIRLPLPLSLENELKIVGGRQ